MWDVRRSVTFWAPLARLAPGPVARLRFWATAFELTLRHKAGRPPRRTRTVRLHANGTPASFTLGEVGELHGLREVLVRGDYELEVERPPERILDLGGNVGAATVLFANRWPEAQIVVVEPDPAVYERLARNTRPFARIRALRLAAAEADGEAALYRSGYTLTHSLMQEAGGEPTRVRTASLDTLLDECGGPVDLVKFDIEGMEYELVRACERRAEIPLLIGELHERIMGASLDEFAGLFPRHHVEVEPLPNGEHMFRARLRS